MILYKFIDNSGVMQITEEKPKEVDFETIEFIEEEPLIE